MRSSCRAWSRVHQEKGEVRSAKRVLAPLQLLRHVSGQCGTDIGFQPEMDHRGIVSRVRTTHTARTCRGQVTHRVPSLSHRVVIIGVSQYSRAARGYVVQHQVHGATIWSRLGATHRHETTLEGHTIAARMACISCLPR